MPKENPRPFLPLTFLVLHTVMAARSHAEVTLDGSLGQSGVLSGPDYVIRADMGRQVDTNLFHSFGIFNINTYESATFTRDGAIGPIENILGHVTGGSLSNIDGWLRSTIPGADLLKLSPMRRRAAGATSTSGLSEVEFCSSLQTAS
jgi:filamentous hemagglutinin family protein